MSELCLQERRTFDSVVFARDGGIEHREIELLFYKTQPVALTAREVEPACEARAGGWDRRLTSSVKVHVLHVPCAASRCVSTGCRFPSDVEIEAARSLRA